MNEYKYIIFDKDSLICNVEEFLQKLKDVMNELGLNELKVEMEKDSIFIDIEEVPNDKLETLLGHLMSYLTSVKLIPAHRKFLQNELDDLYPTYLEKKVNKDDEEKLKELSSVIFTARNVITPGIPNRDILGNSYRARINELLQDDVCKDKRLYTDKVKQEKIQNRMFPLQAEAILNVLAKGKRGPELYTELEPRQCCGYENLKNSIDELKKVKELVSIGTEYGLSARQFKVLDETISEQVRNIIKSNVVTESLRTVGLIYGLTEQQFSDYMEQLEQLVE